MKREKQRRKCLKDENCGAGGEPSPPSLGRERRRRRQIARVPSDGQDKLAGSAPRSARRGRPWFWRKREAKYFFFFLFLKSEA